MIESDDKMRSGYADLERFHTYLRERRGVRARPQSVPLGPPELTTWFEHQAIRLAQLEASPTRAITDEERESLGYFFDVGSTVRVCSFQTPPDIFQIGFALNSPAANVLVGYSLKLAEQMALRMEMLTGRHRSPHRLVRELGRGRAPLLLLAAVGRPGRPVQVRHASIGLAGSARWFTDFSTFNQQILLVHEVGDLEPACHPPERIDYLLAYPKFAPAEDQH